MEKIIILLLFSFQCYGQIFEYKTKNVYKNNILEKSINVDYKLVLDSNRIIIDSKRFSIKHKLTIVNKYSVDIHVVTHKGHIIWIFENGCLILYRKKTYHLE